MLHSKILNISFSNIIKVSWKAFAIIPIPDKKQYFSPVEGEVSNQVERILTSSTWNRKEIVQWQKKQIIQKLSKFDGDTGNSAVQGKSLFIVENCHFLSVNLKKSISF